MAFILGVTSCNLILMFPSSVPRTPNSPAGRKESPSHKSTTNDDRSSRLRRVHQLREEVAHDIANVGVLDPGRERHHNQLKLVRCVAMAAYVESLESPVVLSEVELLELLICERYMPLVFRRSDSDSDRYLRSKRKTRARFSWPYCEDTERVTRSYRQHVWMEARCAALS